MLRTRPPRFGAVLAGGGSKKAGVGGCFTLGVRFFFQAFGHRSGSLFSNVAEVLRQRVRVALPVRSPCKGVTIAFFQAFG